MEGSKPQIEELTVRACVLGATGGVGDALVETLIGSYNYRTVYAGSRCKTAIGLPGVESFAFDLKDEKSIKNAACRIGSEGKLDLIIVATGLLHRTPCILPEKSMGLLEPENMHELFAINAIGPAILAKHFLPLLNSEARAVAAFLSARVGSISDNKLGGWYSYRASKAALNALVKCFAIELGRTNPGAVAVTIHPGTVDTALSKPFKRGVPNGKLLTPAQSSTAIMKVINSLTPNDSGGFFAWDGSAIPF